MTVALCGEERNESHGGGLSCQESHALIKLALSSKAGVLLRWVGAQVEVAAEYPTADRAAQGWPMNL